MYRIGQYVFRAQLEADIGGGRRFSTAVNNAIVLLPIGTDGQNILDFRDAIIDEIGDAPGTKIIEGMFRFAFAFQCLETQKGAPRYNTRWTTTSIHGNTDPRLAEYPTCLAILDKLISDYYDITAEDPSFPKLLKDYCASVNPQVTYEIPIDYISTDSLPIHCPENIEWVNSSEFRTLLTFRSSLMNSTIEDRVVKAALDTCQLKTYRTGRQQTHLRGYYTNREYRWECHPGNEQSARFRDCAGIELVLLKQLCGFDNFPASVKRSFVDNKYLMDQELTKCFITLERLDFNRFSSEVTNPEHGSSSFHLGHLYPIKADRGPDEQKGHTPDNVAWASSDGNRIQEKYSIEETRELLNRIFVNYRNHGLLTADKKAGIFQIIMGLAIVSVTIWVLISALK